MYLFYLDESGARDPDVGNRSAPSKDHLYVLLAVGIWEGHWRKLDRNVSEVKIELADRLKASGLGQFDLADCEVKSNWLRNAKERAQKSPFLNSLSDADRTRLADTFYKQLTECRAVVFAAVVDKRHLFEYMTHETLHKKAYEFILEQIENFMGEYHEKHKALIVMDDTSKALNRAIAMKHAYFQRAGNQHVQFRHVIEYPFFTRSELSNGVQLADLCAYNVYRAFKMRDFEYSYFEQTLPHIYKRAAAPQLDGLKVWPEASDLIQFARDGWTTYRKKKPANGGSISDG